MYFRISGSRLEEFAEEVEELFLSESKVDFFEAGYTITGEKIASFELLDCEEEFANENTRSNGLNTENKGKGTTKRIDGKQAPTKSSKNTTDSQPNSKQTQKKVNHKPERVHTHGYLYVEYLKFRSDARRAGHLTVKKARKSSVDGPSLTDLKGL